MVGNVAAEDVSAGRLERVLKEFLPRRPGLFVYFPARMQTQPKLRAFIDLAVARLRMRGKPTPYDESEWRRPNRVTCERD
jgi:DNA-binding transcriptional LysR family regulator